jgi:hypothetical protein
MFLKLECHARQSATSASYTKSKAAEDGTAQCGRQWVPLVQSESTVTSSARKPIRRQNGVGRGERACIRCLYGDR